MISFPAILAQRNKRTLVVYSREERVNREFRAFVELAKSRGIKFAQFMASRKVTFPEGGHVTFKHVESEFRGLEIDEYHVEDAVKLRLDGAPLLTLLATRKR